MKANGGNPRRGREFCHLCSALLCRVCQPLKELTTVVGLISLILLGSVALAPSAYAVGGVAGVFEMDGDAVDNTTMAYEPEDDWDNVISENAKSDALTYVFQDGGRGGSLFTKGAKDILPIHDWHYRVGSVPPGNDFINSYAAAYVNGSSELILTCGVDRYQTNGNFAIGCWFFQDDVGPDPDSDGFVGQHTDGDILITAEFGGRGLTAANVFKWSGNGETGGLVAIGGGSLKAGNNKQCSDISDLSGESACGETNLSPIDIPWEAGSTYKSYSGELVPPGTFVEVIINLSELLQGNTSCFTTFMATSRASAEESAELKEFAVGNFPLCGMEVSKTCSNPRLNAANDMIIYDITGVVKNTGFGTLYNVSVSDAPALDQGSLSLGNLAPASQVPYAGTITVPLSGNGGSDTVTASGNTASDGSGTAVGDTASATCPNLQISPSLSVSKYCDASVAVNGGLVAAKVNVSGTVCNVGDSLLTNVSVTDSEAVSLTLGSTTLVKPADPSDPGATEGACTTFTGSYFPDAALNARSESTTEPEEVIFTDTVTANAEDIFGFAVEPQMDSACCPLCPGNGSCSTDQ